LALLGRKIIRGGVTILIIVSAINAPTWAFNLKLTCQTRLFCNKSFVYSKESVHCAFKLSKEMIMTHHILFEINEICPHLIEHFEEKGLLPNFTKYKTQFNRYETQADATSSALEPWIQWYSVHTGLPYKEHGVFRLNEGAHAGYPDIWSVLKEHDYTVMNFGSMNAARLDGDKDIFFPDPWSHEKANPDILQPVAAFIANQVRDYTVPNHKMNYFAFGKALLQHGLTLPTAFMAVKQILKETIKSKKHKYKRIFILDHILMDMFLYYHSLYQPNFATFFTNSVAHIQHAYWRYFEPEKFDNTIERPEFKNAVRDAYVNIDYRLGQVMRYALAHNAKVSIASALSQKPYVKEEETGGRRYYRPRNIDNLLEKLEIVHLSCEAVMTHQYVLRFRNVGAKNEAEKILTNSKLYDAGEASDLFTIKNADNGIGLIFDCKPRIPVTEEAEACINGNEFAFEELFYLIDEVKSGGHDPLGLYWQAADNQSGQSMSEVIMVHKLFDKLLEPFDRVNHKAN
jgi:hypothetical protein